MGLDDEFSFRKKPSGLFKWLMKAPQWIFRLKLGFLMGDRFLLLTHLGRKSGATFRTPLEVVIHDANTGEYVVCSGTGPRADWWLNINAQPAVSVQVRNNVWAPEQRFLDPDEAARRFHEYELAHAKTAARLLQSMGQHYDGTDDDRVRMMANIPMASFTPVQPDLANDPAGSRQDCSGD